MVEDSTYSEGYAMNVRLTEHAVELLAAVRAQRHEPVERILEDALEMLARQENVDAGQMTSAGRERAVREMLDFVRDNRVQLAPGELVKDLIHEGHRI